MTTASATAPASPQLATPRLSRILTLVLAWRVVLLLTFAACAHFLPAQPDEIAFTTNHEPQIEAAMRSPGTGAVRWDAYYYLHISAHGYRADEPRDFAFFPLFPLAVAALHRLGLPLIAAGLLLNLIATALAAVFLYLLALDYTRDDLKAQRAVLLFLVFPSAYFLAAYYAEAVFCALGFAAFYLARRRRWFAANILLGLLTASRPPAFCFVLAIAAEFLLSQWHRSPTRDGAMGRLGKVGRGSPAGVLHSALSFFLAPLGLVAHFVYLHDRWGDALLYTRVLGKYWRHTQWTPNLLRPLWTTAQSAAAHGHFDFWTEAIHLWTVLACTLAALIILLHAARRLPISYSVLLASTLVVTLSSGTLVSAHRYLLPLFPLYLVLADELSTLRRRAWLATSAALMTFLLAAFVNFRFTG
ncbi:MAG: hypothetical protein LAN64_13965 [Acidobacteriia bacterium]|nr:hypothetical protein [Terriglobia bacterium]